MKPIRGLGLLAFALLVLSACASLGVREPLRVNVAALEPLPSEGLEARFALKLRVQNPNDVEIEFDGVALDLELAGRDFASGVSGERGRVPRYGEALITVPVTVPLTAIVRQILGVANEGPGEKLNYRLRGHLGGTGFGRIPFDSSGELNLPGPRNPRP